MSYCLRFVSALWSDSVILPIQDVATTIRYLTTNTLQASGGFRSEGLSLSKVPASTVTLDQYPAWLVNFMWKLHGAWEKLVGRRL